MNLTYSLVRNVVLTGFAFPVAQNPIMIEFRKECIKGVGGGREKRKNRERGGEGEKESCGSKTHP